MNRERLFKPFFLSIVAAGGTVMFYSLARLTVEQLDWRFFVLLCVMAVVAARLSVSIPRVKGEVTVGDTLIFLTMMLYGGQAAVLMAAVDGMASSLYVSKKARVWVFNCSQMVVSTFVTTSILKTLFGPIPNLDGANYSILFLAAICLMALIQYICNSGLVAIYTALKTGRPIIETWRTSYLWTSISYFAGASIASIAVHALKGASIYAVLLVTPVVAIIYVTYKTYLKNVESSAAQAEQAERHATEQARISNVLRESEEHFRGAFDYAAVGMALVARDGTWLKVNQALCNLVGYSQEELLRMNFQSITHPDDLGGFLSDLYQMSDGKMLTCAREKRYINKQGHIVWAAVSASSVLNTEGKPMHFILQVQDISERKAAEEKLHHAAFYDSLTSLPNRALFTENLQRAIDQAKRHDSDLYAVLFLDIDSFKNINDSLGHVIGDQLLVNVARRLENCMRSGDMVARFGGDEFAVLLSGIGHITEAIEIAKRFQKNLLPPFSLDGHEVFTSASIGIAVSTLEWTKPEEILRDADTAMYRAKEQGKGRYEIFDRVMLARAISRLQLENDLRRAVECSDFEVHYQPILNLQHNCISGFEALVRWRHPERGLVSPTEFISLAEETEMILPIGDFVLLESCRQIKEWQERWPLESPLTISVNLSAKQFIQSDLVDRVKHVLYQTKLDPQCLRLEITESVVMENAEATAAMLRQLRLLGVQLSIDDFGTGYSSLSYLHKFPFDILKIDQSFVSRMCLDPESKGIAETILILARKLNKRVVAEGIETAEQLAELKALNCGFGQGYYFSRPVPAVDAEKLIMSKDSRLRLSIPARCSEEIVIEAFAM